MALMGFREGDQVLWGGIRPGHLGTQIAESLLNVSNDYGEIYEVTAGKVLYLTSWWIHFWSSAAGVGNIQVRTAAPGPFFMIFRCEDDGAFKVGMTGNFWPPLEVPALHTIDLRTTELTSEISGGFAGWEE